MELRGFWFAVVAATWAAVAIAWRERRKWERGIVRREKRLTEWELSLLEREDHLAARAAQLAHVEEEFRRDFPEADLSHGTLEPDY